MIEKDWVDTFKNLEKQLYYKSYKRTAERLAQHLRENEKCDYVFALAHMREHNDIELA